MVMIGLYAKRYCCLAIDCRVIYKKRFLRARCLLLSSFAHKMSFSGLALCISKDRKISSKKSFTRNPR